MGKIYKVTSLLRAKFNHKSCSFCGVPKTICLYPLEMIGINTKKNIIAEKYFMNGFRPVTNLLFCQR